MQNEIISITIIIPKIDDRSFGRIIMVFRVFMFNNFTNINVLINQAYLVQDEWKLKDFTVQTVGLKLQVQFHRACVPILKIQIYLKFI
jgi:hypothetical protein